MKNRCNLGQRLTIFQISIVPHFIESYTTLGLFLYIVTSVLNLEFLNCIIFLPVKF